MNEAELRAMLKKAQQPDPPNKHLDPMLLFDYLEGDLEGPVADQVREHLVICRGCRQELKAMDEPFEAGVQEGTQPSVGAASASQDSLDPIQPEPETKAKLIAIPNKWRNLALAGWGAAAAALTLAFVIWSSRISQPEPTAKATMLTLLATSTTSRGDEPTAPSHLPLVLALSFTEPTTATVFSLELRTVEDRQLLWRGPATRGSDGLFLLSLPARFLPAKPITIDLLGSNQNDPERVLASYLIHLRNR